MVIRGYLYMIMIFGNILKNKNIIIHLHAIFW